MHRISAPEPKGTVTNPLQPESQKAHAGYNRRRWNHRRRHRSFGARDHPSEGGVLFIWSPRQNNSPQSKSRVRNRRVCRAFRIPTPLINGIGWHLASSNLSRIRGRFADGRPARPGTSPLRSQPRLTVVEQACHEFWPVGPRMDRRFVSASTKFHCQSTIRRKTTVMRVGNERADRRHVRSE